MSMAVKPPRASEAGTDAGSSPKHPLAGTDHDRRRHDRPGPRRRGRRHDLRLQRRRDPADLRRDLPLQRGRTPKRGDPPRSCRRPSRARASWRRATRARAAGRRVPRHLGSGRDQLGDADPRLPGRLGSGGADHRPGAARRDGHRRVPGSAGLQHHGGLRQARLPASPTRPRSRRRCARAFDIARSGRPGSGRGRHPARRAAARRASSRAPGCCRCAATTSASTRSSARRISAGRRARRSSRCSATAERPLIYAGGGVINGDAAPELRAFAERFGIPVVTTLLGIGAIDTTSELSLQHARHARHGVRQLRRRGLRLPLRGRLALRRPRRRQGEGVRARRDDRAPRHRRLRDRQGEERRLGARRRRQARPAAAASRPAPASRRTSRRWREHVARAEARSTRSTTTASRPRSRPSTCSSS